MSSWWDKDVFKETLEGLVPICGILLVATMILGSLLAICFLPFAFFVPLLVVWIVLALFGCMYGVGVVEKREREGR